MSNEHRHPDCNCGPTRIETPPGGSIGWLRLTRRSVVRALGAALAASIGSAARAAELLGRCGPPPPPRPAQASAAEGIPPLPLPAVPQRRTEKKNPPRPPVVLTKIRTATPDDWATDPNDVNNLLAWMKSTLKVNFTYEEKGLSETPLESGNVPVLYRTGHNAFTFNPSERTRLRQYLLGGGLMIFDACCGRRSFTDSARREIKAILPDHELKPVSLDHPVFNCYYENAGWVRRTPHTLAHHPGLRSPGPSGIEGIEIACRMAVLFSPHDLSCGWDMHTHAFPDTAYIESEDALKIGANFLAYATATRETGVGLADAKAYIDAEPTRTDKFRVGQLIHEGDWNPDPVGLRNLLDTVARTTALRLSFATEAVTPDTASLSRFPFIYLTGHDDFTWSDGQVANLRRHLENGGFLFADACCGRQKFDQAFRREMSKVLRSNTDPAARLQPLPPAHPLYQIHQKVKRVRYTRAARSRMGDTQTDRPRLESAALEGRTAVLYSPIGMNVGWRLKPVPYAVNYEPRSALALGVNVVMYAVSQ